MAYRIYFQKRDLVGHHSILLFRLVPFFMVVWAIYAAADDDDGMMHDLINDRRPNLNDVPLDRHPDVVPNDGGDRGEVPIN